MNNIDDDQAEDGNFELNRTVKNFLRVRKYLLLNSFGQNKENNNACA